MRVSASKQPADHILDRLAWNTIAVGAGLILLIGLIITVATFIGAKGWRPGSAALSRRSAADLRPSGSRPGIFACGQRTAA